MVGSVTYRSLKALYRRQTGRRISEPPTRRRGPRGGDAEIKGRSPAESERREEVASFAVRRRGAPTGREWVAATPLSGAPRRLTGCMSRAVYRVGSMLLLGNPTRINRGQD
jgi:hypothetical protein